MNKREYACGVICLFSGDQPVAMFEAELGAETASGRFAFALVFFSKTAISEAAFTAMMAERCPGLNYAGCSTAGEITPLGVGDGQIVALLFPRQCFTIHATRIPGLKDNSIEDIVACVGDAKRSFLKERVCHNGSTDFAVCLMDGMSFMEEALTAAMHWGLDDIPLIGGSAGDELNFRETMLVLNGRRVTGGALLLLFNSRLPVHIFKTENFIPTEKKLVVTRSDPEKRIVHELNALPAAKVYADVIGTDPEALTPQSFASHPLVMRVGGQYYCRSIQKVNPDDSLSFFCAIDDGIVLTVAEPTGMARTTSAKFDSIRDDMGDIDFILGFDCVLRRIDARNRQVNQKISQIYRDNNVVGFATYGEQFNSMHLNQTFTGIAFGRCMVDAAE